MKRVSGAHQPSVENTVFYGHSVCGSVQIPMRYLEFRNFDHILGVQCTELKPFSIPIYTIIESGLVIEARILT